MVGVIVVLLLAAVSGWFGWKKNMRNGLIASVGIPLILSIVAAFSISVPAPGEVGKIWVFVITSVVLTGFSLLSFGAAYFLGPSQSKNSKQV